MDEPSSGDRDVQLDLALEAAQMGAWALDLRTGEVQTAGPYARVVGGSTVAADFRFHDYRDFLAVVHPDDREAVATSPERILRARGAFEEEFRVVWPDGSVHWLLSKGRVLSNPEGRRRLVTGVLQDITERKHALEDRVRLAAIVESSDDAIIGKTLEGIITSWNAAAERTYGYAAGEVIGRSISLLVPPNLTGEVATILERLSKGEHLRNFETVRVRKDGTSLDVSLTISPVYDARGEIVGASTIARDVSERRRAEEQRRILLDAERSARSKAELTLQRLARLQRVTEAGLARLSIDELLTVMLDRVREVLGIHYAAVVTAEDDSMLAVQAALGAESDMKKGVRLPDSGVIAQVMAAGRPLVIDEARANKGGGFAIGPRGVEARVIVPLVVENHPIGVLDTGSIAPHRFGEDEVELLQLVADRIAMAIDRSRASERERTISRSLQLLRSGGGSLTSESEDEAGELPVGTVTFLLTDIEDSTRLWEAARSSVHRAFARHDALVTKHIERCHGLRPRDQGEGDSALAVFAQPGDAVACALSLQLALHSEPWEEEASIRVRMALHTGEAELTGRNYKGPELHRCARLRAIAHGGQTLLSFATAHLLGTDLLPPRVVLKPLGSHHLRGFSEPEEVFQLCHPELPSMFPQLHTEAPEATESEQDPRHLLDQLSEPVVAANGESRIVYLNPAAERLLGWEQDELLGQPLLTIVPHRLRPAHLAGFERYLATRRAKVLGRTVRVVALRRDGTEVPVELNLNAAEDSRGRQTFVATLHASEHEPGATESEPIQMLD